MRQPPAPATPAPRPAFAHPWRFAIVASGLTLVAMLAAFALYDADTSPVSDPLPEVVESATPAEGTIVPPQTPIVLDLADDLTVYRLQVRYANGQTVEVPVDELEVVPALGQFTFRPGPGRALSRYEPGEVTVVVTTAEQADPATPGASHTFSFTSKS